jgi:hypothetical protein
MSLVGAVSSIGQVRHRDGRSSAPSRIAQGLAEVAAYDVAMGVRAPAYIPVPAMTLTGTSGKVGSPVAC